MKARCLIEISFPDGKAAQAALEALSHEKDVGGRSKAKMERDGRSLRLSIEAGDVVAMRAAANAFMRGLQAFEGLEGSRGVL